MIERARFTPQGENPDCAVPAGKSRTVPTEQMARLLAGLLNTHGQVLELGTGSGYQTAMLAECCKEVVTVETGELDEALMDKLPENVVSVRADGLTYDSGEQFDGILVTFAATAIMPEWVKQLRRGARLVLPRKLGATCRIEVHERDGERLRLLGVAAYANFTEAITEAA